MTNLDFTAYGFVSYWYNATVPSGNPDQNATAVGKPIQIRHLGQQLQIIIAGSQQSATGPSFDNPLPYSANLNRQSDEGALPLDGARHHVMIAWDTNALTADVVLDGQTLPISDPNGYSTTTPFLVPYKLGTILVGGDPDLDDWFVGSIAEFYFLAGTKVNLNSLAFV